VRTHDDHAGRGQADDDGIFVQEEKDSASKAAEGPDRVATLPDDLLEDVAKLLGPPLAGELRASWRDLSTDSRGNPDAVWAAARHVHDKLGGTRPIRSPFGLLRAKARQFGDSGVPEEMCWPTEERRERAKLQQERVKLLDERKVRDAVRQAAKAMRGEGREWGQIQEKVESQIKESNIKHDFSSSECEKRLAWASQELDAAKEREQVAQRTPLEEMVERFVLWGGVNTITDLVHRIEEARARPLDDDARAEVEGFFEAAVQRRRSAQAKTASAALAKNASAALAKNASALGPLEDTWRRCGQPGRHRVWWRGIK
jgi:hypothetical protein